MIRKLLGGLWLACSAFACQHASATPPPQAQQQASSPFEPTGRILVGPPLRGPSASFNQDRVIGPSINVSRKPDGTWAGWIRGRAVNLDVKGTEISAASVSVNVQELPDGVEVRGLWVQGGRSQEIAIRVSPKEFYAREPYVSPPIFLDVAAPGVYGTGAYAKALVLEGDAAMLHPPEPQFALALLGGL